MSDLEFLRKRVCCVDLLNAIADQFIHLTVSGLFFIPHNESGCCSETPRIKICPFCGAEIITIKEEKGWDWKTEKAVK